MVRDRARAGDTMATRAVASIDPASRARYVASQTMSAPVVSNDLRAQWRAIAEDATRALARVGESGWLVLGEEVRAFEAELAPRFGCAHAVGTANGLDAIEIALRAAGLAPGDRVLTTPLSAFATTLAIVRAGGVPVFVDVDASGLVDLGAVDARLARGDIRFFLPVHLYGHALDLDRALAITRARSVMLLEDCAQSIGAKSRGVLTGSVGVASATSFYPTKNLGCLGDGGALVTNDDALARAARSLRDYGQSSKYVHADLGLNSRLDELQAAFLRSALLPRLDAFTSRREAIAAAYTNGIRRDGIVLPEAPPGSASVWHLFPVLSSRRDALIAHLRAHDIQSAVHYPGLIPHQAALRSVPFEVAGMLERAEAFARSEVSLPIHPFMTDADVARVIDACNAF